MNQPALLLPAQRVNHTGKRFGRLTALRPLPTVKNVTWWECRCDCGEVRGFRTGNLVSGVSKSCGCLQKQLASKKLKVHGLSRHTLYARWRNMIDRCCNKDNKHYKNYGGRGIDVVSEWMIFQHFYGDNIGRWSSGMDLDRIDNSSGYSLKNTRWITRAENTRNKRSNIKYNGECAADASKRLGGKHNLVNKRVRDGWSLERAFNTPVKK